MCFMCSVKSLAIVCPVIHVYQKTQSGIVAPNVAPNSGYRRKKRSHRKWWYRLEAEVSTPLGDTSIHQLGGPTVGKWTDLAK